ncbi:MAG TPA: hypothetical protein VEB20_19130 [Azospirillaceae bacterium]|nr:hypothetical protein [Azospirillaceae bacterium]
MSSIRHSGLVALVAVLPLLLLVAWREAGDRQARIEAVGAMAVAAAQRAADEQSLVVEGIRQTLVALSHVPAVRAGGADCARLMADLAGRYPHLAVLGRTDAEGSVTCSSTAAAGSVSVRDRGYFEEARTSGALAVSELLLDRLSGRQVIQFAQPLAGEAGFEGVMLAALDVAWLQSRLDRGPATAEGVLTVMDRTGTVLARLPRGAEAVGLPFQSFRRLLNAGPAASGAGTIEAQGVDGVTRLYGYIPTASDPAGLFIAFGVDRDAAAAGATADLGLDLALAAAAALAGIGLAAWAAGRRNGRPARGA